MVSVNKMYKDYQTCFNPDGSVKACGRDACKKLIAELSEVYSGVDFGNVDTGYVNDPAQILVNLDEACLNPQMRNYLQNR